MQQESSLVPVGEHGGYQEFRIRSSAKKGPSLKGDGGDCVGIDNAPRTLIGGKHTPGGNERGTLLSRWGHGSNKRKEIGPAGPKGLLIFGSFVYGLKPVPTSLYLTAGPSNGNVIEIDRC